MHQREAVVMEEPRLEAAAGSFTETSLRCRKRSCSFAPSAEMECYVGPH